MAAANVLFPNGGQSVPLPNVSVTGLPVGFILTDSGGTSWQLTVSAAAIDHTSAEAVANNPNLRWLVFTGGGGGLSPIPDQDLLGNVSGGSATPVGLTPTQVRTALGVQASSAVAITGGTITGITSWPYSRWEYQQRLFMLGKIPQLTDFDYQKIGQYQLGVSLAGSSANDGNVEGGGEGAPGTSTKVTFGSTIFQTPRSGKWAISARLKMTVPTAARVQAFGLVSSSGTHQIDFTAAFAVNATKWVLETNGATAASANTTANADALVHDLVLTSDGTTIHSYIDQVDTGASLAATAINSDEGYLPFIVNTTAGDIVLYKLCYGYIAP